MQRMKDPAISRTAMSSGDLKFLRHPVKIHQNCIKVLMKIKWKAITHQVTSICFSTVLTTAIIKPRVLNKIELLLYWTVICGGKSFLQYNENCIQLHIQIKDYSFKNRSIRLFVSVCISHYSLLKEKKTIVIFTSTRLPPGPLVT